jgi:hypothetical protein
MNAPPENANARRQPGVRVIKQTYKTKLRTRKRHVNAPDGWPGGKLKQNPIAIGGAVRE